MSPPYHSTTSDMTRSPIQIMVSNFYIQIWRGAPYKTWVSIIVATGTTLNLAADRIHSIGSWGISHISQPPLA
eukprot:2802613-Pleurochrysis_carterae.AAC.2